MKRKREAGLSCGGLALAMGLFVWGMNTLSDWVATHQEQVFQFFQWAGSFSPLVYILGLTLIVGLGAAALTDSDTEDGDDDEL